MDEPSELDRLREELARVRKAVGKVAETMRLESYRWIDPTTVDLWSQELSRIVKE